MKSILHKIVDSGWGEDGSKLMTALKKSCRKDREIIAMPVVKYAETQLGVNVMWVDRRIIKEKPCQIRYKKMYLRRFEEAKEVISAFSLALQEAQEKITEEVKKIK